MKFKTYKKNIDIVVPFYNEFKNLKTLIPKIIKSTSNFKQLNIRYIFINDGSTDDSDKIIKKYLKSKNFYLLKSKKKLGQTLSYKKYLKLFKSDFFIRIDSDNPIIIPININPMIFNIINERVFRISLSTKRESWMGCYHHQWII